MNLELIKEKYRNGEYDPDFKKLEIGKLIPITQALNSKKNPLFDRNKTIIENEELVKQHNEEVAKQMDIRNEELKSSYEKLANDIILAIQNEISVNKSQAEIIYNRVYENYNVIICNKKHEDDGMIGILNKLNDELKYIQDILINERG